jgi:conjugal transfer pilus assembly protein TraV
VRKNALLIAVGLLAALTSGCSTIGVYDSEFSCPKAYNGRCISVSGAYDLAKKGHDDPEHDPDDDRGKKKESVQSRKKQVETEQAEAVAVAEESAHTSYKESLYRRFDGLLKEPDTPMVAPPQVMRILLLPYKGEGNELFMPRYVYMFVDEPRWVLGDSLVAIEED